MPRIRSIKPDFFQSEQVAALAFEWRLLFEGLWILADREGRLIERPQRMKAAIFPYDTLDVAEGLAAIERAGLIVRYTDTDGRALIAIPTWHRHQHPHVREQASILQAPDGHHAGTGRARGKPVRSRSRSRSRSFGSEERGAKNAPLPPHPVEKRNGASVLPRALRYPKGQPDVRVLAALILREVLPLGLTPADAREAAKEHAARKHLAYDGDSIEAAFASAQAQHTKGAHS